MEKDFGEPWSLDDHRDTSWSTIRDRDDALVITSQHPSDRALFERVSACVSFLKGIPTKALLASLTETKQVALAVIAGEPDWALFDKLTEERTAGDATPPGKEFVPRAELVNWLRILVGSFTREVHIGHRCLQATLDDDVIRRAKLMLTNAEGPPSSPTTEGGIRSQIQELQRQSQKEQQRCEGMKATIDEQIRQVRSRCPHENSSHRSDGWRLCGDCGSEYRPPLKTANS
jgi:hypothetical protein